VPSGSVPKIPFLRPLVTLRVTTRSPSSVITMSSTSNSRLLTWEVRSLYPLLEIFPSFDVLAGIRADEVFVDQFVDGFDATGCVPYFL